MSSTAAQAITHTGATGFDFSLVSINEQQRGDFVNER